jgi:hypothetical protein
MQLPPMPDLPPPLRGRAFVIVEAVAQLDPAATSDLLAPLRDLEPEIDTVGEIPVETLDRLHMDPPGPVPGAGHGGLLAELPPEAVDALVAVAGDGSGSPLLSVELRHLGGALATAPAGAGALATLDAAFAYFAVGVAPDPATQAKVERHVDLVIAALGPWRAERAFRNFAERRSAATTFSDEATLTRLRRVKSAYDPRDVIRANHPVAPADS